MEIRWMILNGIEWVRSTSNKLEIFGTLCQSHCMVMHKQCGTIPTKIQNMATLFQTSLTIPYWMARLNLSLTGQCISITVMHCCFAATVPTLWNPVHLESPWLHPYTVIKWPYFHLSDRPRAGCHFSKQIGDPWHPSSECTQWNGSKQNDWLFANWTLTDDRM